ncbi:MAG: hypothetical protein IM568_00600 [Flavobacterium sp.]|nr:hypothetical protein [Flavobacterium sp.]
MSEKTFEIGGIRKVSKKDIAVMKWNAIAGKGSKKDFIDLYFLLNEFSLREMMDFIVQNILMVLNLWFIKVYLILKKPIFNQNQKWLKISIGKFVNKKSSKK